MSTSLKLIEMSRNLGILYELNCSPGDSVLVLSDTAQESDVWAAVSIAGRAFGCEVTIMLMADPRESHMEPPPKPVMEAMKVADVTIGATSKEFHTGGHFLHCVLEGKKYIVMEEVNSEMLMGSAVKADYKIMNEVGPKLKEIMDKGGKWHITSDTGTDYTCRVKPGTGRYMAAKADKDMNHWGIAFASFPDGEFGAEPIPGSGNGTVVWDTSVHYPPGLLQKHIKLTIEDGIVKKIEGGKEAEQLINFMKQHGTGGNNDEFDIELSIGLNPKSPITGILRTDKKHYGKLHTAIGDMKKQHLHIDGVTLKPTITIENEIIVEKGKIKISPLDEWC